MVICWSLPVVINVCCFLILQFRDLRIVFLYYILKSVTALFFLMLVSDTIFRVDSVPFQTFLQQSLIAFWPKTNHVYLVISLSQIQNQSFLQGSLVSCRNVFRSLDLGAKYAQCCRSSLASRRQGSDIFKNLADGSVKDAIKPVQGSFRKQYTKQLKKFIGRDICQRAS